MNRNLNNWKPLTNINYCSDKKRYQFDQYCGTCTYNIRIYTDLGDGQPYRCEECDANFSEGDNSLVFHQKCPCYCYICQECDSNLLKTTAEEDEDCQYGNHAERRGWLLARLGLTNDY